MKTILRTLSLLSVLLFGTAWGAPTLSKEQIIQLGHVVLSAPENKDYKDMFWNAQPQYDEKTAIWRFNAGSPVTPGGAAYIFEFRDADGYYRLGWITGQKSSQSFERFRIQPSARAKLTKLMKTFRNP
jgi:hypothetical protein